MTYEPPLCVLIASLWPDARHVVSANDAAMPHAASRVTDQRVAGVSPSRDAEDRREGSWHGQCIEEHWERVERAFQRSGKGARGSPSALIKGN